MSKVNFILEWICAMEVLANDSRIYPTHRSVYFALFHKWNQLKFPGIFQVNREEIMFYSGVRSKTTYHKCLRELEDFGIINYMPSNNMYQGSRITMTIFWSTSVLRLDKLCPTSGQALIHIKNSLKQLKHLKQYREEDNQKINNLNVENSKVSHQKPSVEEVISFFLAKNQEDSAGRKFFNHYQSRGWITTSNQPITDWKAAAELWIEKSKEFTSRKPSSKVPKLRPTGIQPTRN